MSTLTSSGGGIPLMGDVGHALAETAGAALKLGYSAVSDIGDTTPVFGHEGSHLYPERRKKTDRISSMNHRLSEKNDISDLNHSIT
jgi:hypothetical protein